MFIYSHLVALIDQASGDDFNDAGFNEQLQRNIMDKAVDIIYHPGDSIGLAGFFLNNTDKNIIASLTALEDD